MLEPPGESTHSPEDGVCVVHDTKLALIKIPKDEQGISVTLPQSSDLRFPGPLASLEDISYKYSPISPVVLQDISLSIHIGDRIGIVGLNGGGKSTLIKIVSDTVHPTRGIVTRESTSPPQIGALLSFLNMLSKICKRSVGLTRRKPLQTAALCGTFTYRTAMRRIARHARGAIGALFEEPCMHCGGFEKVERGTGVLGHWGIGVPGYVGHMEVRVDGNFNSRARMWSSEFPDNVINTRLSCTTDSSYTNIASATASSATAAGTWRSAERYYPDYHIVCFRKAHKISSSVDG